MHPRWRQQWELPHAPILFELALDAVLAHPLPVAEPLPRQQAVERDIAVVVKESVTHAQLMQAIHAASSARLLRSATLFDIYRLKAGADTGANASMAANEKSLAVRLVLDGGAESLTDERTEEIVQAILNQLQADVGARLRA